MVDQLSVKIEAATAIWRKQGYLCEAYPAIAEILEYARDEGTGALRYLRAPQLLALEVYWYLRLQLETPKMLDIYKRLYDDLAELLDALGLTDVELKNIALNQGVDGLLERIADDDGLVAKHHLEGLRESLGLDYPSYIFALAMGAGKTLLMGAIIATEFAMAMEYPDHRGVFVENALVFAPGKTIFNALRQLAEVPFDLILPPRFFKQFASRFSLLFTRDGDPDIPVIPASLFNVVITNTEKIRIQAESITKGLLGQTSFGQDFNAARRQVANRRLRAICSLPNLGIFSDEAHHTYGQALETELKRVRQTVDYIAQQTSVHCVVNTTGTPYYKRQLLRDVVVWYGLGEGIKDNILKDVRDSIWSLDFDPEQAESFVHAVIKDFFGKYRDVALPNGAQSKLAMYFPQVDDLKDLRPAVEAALLGLGLPTSLVLENTNQTSAAEEDAFNRLNDPGAPHRIILLVNKGTEGWNCPSLFACALVRKLKTSNNFVLQASTRCMRQAPGNPHHASIYLADANRDVLEKQLQETYGEGLSELFGAHKVTRTARLSVRKTDLPPLVLRKLRRAVRPKQQPDIGALQLRAPQVAPEHAPMLQQLKLVEVNGQVALIPGLASSIDMPDTSRSLYSAAVELAVIYRLEPLALRAQLRRLFSDREWLLEEEVADLSRQLAAQTANYEEHSEVVEVELALVKLKGFDKDEAGYYTRLIYTPERENLLLKYTPGLAGPRDIGWHYDPYDFDSEPEISFFEHLLAISGEPPEDIEEVLFTGGISDPAKTDFFVEYQDETGKWRRYTPDFLVKLKNGRVLIVEVKADRERAHPIDGATGRKAKAMRALADLNAPAVKYHMVFSKGSTLDSDALYAVRSELDGLRQEATDGQ